MSIGASPSGPVLQLTIVIEVTMEITPNNLLWNAGIGENPVLISSQANTVIINPILGTVYLISNSHSVLPGDPTGARDKRFLKDDKAILE